LTVPFQLKTGSGSALPDSAHWLASTDCVNQNQNICSLPTSVVQGQNILGVHYPINPGAEPIQFNVTPQINLCPNGCSGNGDCVHSVCKCFESIWRGDDCSIQQHQLENSEVLYGNITAHQWIYYSLVLLPNTTSIQVNVIWQGSQMQFSPIQVYLKDGGFPSRVSYTEVGASSDFQIQIELQGPFLTSRNWFVGVQGPTVGYTQYNISFESNVFCPLNCNGRGSCIEAVCYCSFPYVGTDCADEIVTLVDGTQAKGSVYFNQWRYFTVSVAGMNGLRIEVQQLQGYVDVYILKNVSLNQLPDYINHDVVSLSGQDPYIFIPSVGPNKEPAWARGKWMIGVTGNLTQMNSGVPAQFSVTVSVGCSTYSTCTLCNLDPNCAWCSPIPSHTEGPTNGFCVGGDSAGSYRYCPSYFYRGCDQYDDEYHAFVWGISSGVASGVGLLAFITLALFFFQKRWKQMYQKRMKPDLIFSSRKRQTTTLDPHGSHGSYGSLTNPHSFGGEPGSGSAGSFSSLSDVRASGQFPRSLLSGSLTRAPSPSDSSGSDGVD